MWMYKAPLAMPAREVVVTPGDRRGRWTLVRACDAPKYAPKSSRHYGEFLCDCGKVKVVDIGEVIQGNSRSCGCAKRETWRRMIKSHVVEMAARGKAGRGK